MKTAIFLSDERMKYVSEEMRRHGHEVIEGGSLNPVDDIIKSASTFDIIILPAAGVKEDGIIKVDNEKADIKDLFSNLKNDAIIFTGYNTDYLKSLGKNVIAYFDDNNLAVKNAELTAEGVLYVVLKHTTKSIFEYTYDLIGYGKTGSQIGGVLSRFNIPLRIVTKEPMKSPGVISYDAWIKNDEPSDIIINTAPEETVTESMLKNIHKRVVIIDISTGGVGVNKCYKTMSNVEVIKAPSLPALVAKESAAKLVSDFILSRV